MKNSWDQETYLKAWNFATVAHKGQTYGGPEEGMRVDYINHISSVTMETIWALNEDNNTDGNLAIQCALLHDSIEDTQTNYEIIVSHFGEAVANGVMALTKNEDLPSKRDQMIDSLERIKAQPKEVWMVKMADRISNLYYPPFYWNAAKILSYRDDALLIYDALHTANGALKNRLKQKIDNYPKFAESRA